MLSRKRAVVFSEDSICAHETLFRKSGLMLTSQDSGENEKREERTCSAGFFEGDDLEVHGFYEQADKELYDTSHI